MFDLLQPAYAALYWGAFHPTAEGHSMVADHVVRHARTVLEQRRIRCPSPGLHVEATFEELSLVHELPNSRQHHRAGPVSISVKRRDIV